MSHTYKELGVEARRLGMTVRRVDGEIRVAFPNNEASAYYTDDVEDAWGTMQLMAKSRKNPFGKRKATHKAFPKAKAKKRTPFGKRKARVVSVTARKNPAPVTLYLIRGTHQNGKRYYFTGASFQTEKRLAARYLSSREADEVLNRIEDRIPPQLKHIDVEHA